jgi:hypothetical protein
LGRREKAWLLSGKADHDRKQVERGSFFGWLPTEFKTEVGEIGLGRIPKKRVFTGPVASVAGKLVVPDTRSPPTRIGGSENSDRGANIAVVSGMSKMTEAALVNFLLGLAVPGIQEIELGPKKTADAPNAVSPSEAATVLQFGRGQSVGSGFFDFAG